jgi:invasion protein IalB
MGRVLMRRLRAAVVLALGLGIGTPAPAQEADPEAGKMNFVGSGWQVQCNNTGTALDCMVLQRITSAEGALIAALAVRAGDATGSALTIQLPLGILVSAPVIMQVDGGVKKSFAIRTCLAAGCVLEAEVPALLLDEMKGGTSLLLSFQSLDAQPISLDIPLNGFALAVERLD